MKYKMGIRYIISIVVFCLMLAGTSVTAGAASTKEISGSNRFDYSYKVLELVNEQRKQAGVPELTMDKELLEAAMLRAAECAVSFKHTRPNGQSCFTICSRMYAENIAMGQSSPEAVMNSWMNSEGHRNNILNGYYQSIGIGCFKYKGTLYWVQDFGTGEANAIAEPKSGKASFKIALKTSAATRLISGAGVNPVDPLSSIVSGFKVKTGKKKLTLKWKKKSGVDGYEIQISNKKSFNNAEVYSVKQNKKQTVITKFKGKKLKSKKKYYVRIRAYKEGKASAEVTTGAAASETDTRSYSKWKMLSKKTK